MPSRWIGVRTTNSTGLGFVPYALKVLKEIKPIVIHFRELGQFIGLFGSSGPSQSTTLATSDAVKDDSSADVAALSASITVPFSLSSDIFLGGEIGRRGIYPLC